MYAVSKGRGYDNVIVTNLDTNASVNIGHITMNILSLLEEDGYKFNKDEEDSLNSYDKWTLNVSNETATKLMNLAFGIKKPIRTKEIKIHKIEQKKNNKEIDAMDVLLGLANYNQKGELLWKNGKTLKVMKDFIK